MTKSITVSAVSFGNVSINTNSTKTTTIINTGTERATILNITSDNSIFTPVYNPFDLIFDLMPTFPISSTIYFDALGRVNNADGSYITSNLGFGYIGSTDSSGVLAVNVVTQMLRLIDPVDGIYINANSTVVINWTFRNITSIDLDYSFDGLNWVNIVNDYSAGFGTYNWTTPETFSDKSITLRIKGGIKEDSHNLTLKADLSSWIIGTATANKTDIVTVPNNEEFSISATATKEDVAP